MCASASEVYGVVGKKRLSSSTKKDFETNSLQSGEKKKTPPNYIITKWGIFLSDYQFFFCFRFVDVLVRSLLRQLRALKLLFLSRAAFFWYNGVQTLPLNAFYCCEEKLAESNFTCTFP
jgi:hypothetical protein